MMRKLLSQRTRALSMLRRCVADVGRGCQKYSINNNNNDNDNSNNSDTNNNDKNNDNNTINNN